MSEARLRKIEQLLSNVLERLENIDPAQGWVSEAEFVKATGLDTKEKLRYWRNHNPTLIKARTSGKLDSMNRSVNRGFMYDLSGYYKSYKNIA